MCPLVRGQLFFEVRPLKGEIMVDVLYYWLTGFAGHAIWLYCYLTPTLFGLCCHIARIIFAYTVVPLCQDP